MLERRTFIVRVHADAGRLIVEDVATGDRIAVPDLASIAAAIELHLASPGDSTTDPDRVDPRA